MSEALGEDFDRDASGERGRGVAVTDVVKTDDREPGRFGLSCEPSTRDLGMDRAAVRLGHHEV